MYHGLVHTISLELQEHQTRNPHLKHKLPRKHLSVFPSALLLRIAFKCASPHAPRMLFTSSYSSFQPAVNTRRSDYKVNLSRAQSNCITYLIQSLIHWCLASRKTCCNRCNWDLRQKKRKTKTTNNQRRLECQSLVFYLCFNLLKT